VFLIIILKVRFSPGLASAGFETTFKLAEYISSTTFTVLVTSAAEFPALSLTL
jgi:hypothetical protein